jgi:hypothetical protein
MNSGSNESQFLGFANCHLVLRDNGIISCVPARVVTSVREKWRVAETVGIIVVRNRLDHILVCFNKRGAENGSYRKS